MPVSVAYGHPKRAPASVGVGLHYHFFWLTIGSLDFLTYSVVGGGGGVLVLFLIFFSVSLTLQSPRTLLLRRRQLAPKHLLQALDRLVRDYLIFRQLFLRGALKYLRSSCRGV